MNKYKEQYQKETGQFWHIFDLMGRNEFPTRKYSDWLEKRLEEAEREKARVLKMLKWYQERDPLNGKIKLDNGEIVDVGNLPGTETPDPNEEEK